VVGVGPSTTICRPRHDSNLFNDQLSRVVFNFLLPAMADGNFCGGIGIFILDLRWGHCGADGRKLLNANFEIYSTIT
jgi:hypothetical protein